MCGILAVILASPTAEAAPELHQALYYLQHRGQDACGITTCSRGGRIYQCKGNGLASNVFRDGKRVADLPGYMGLGKLTVVHVLLSEMASPGAASTTFSAFKASSISEIQHRRYR